MILMGSKPLFRLFFRFRIIAVHPRFVHCHCHFEYSRIVDLQACPKVTNVHSSGDVMRSQGVGDIFGTPFRQVQILGENPVQCCDRQACLVTHSGQGDLVVLCHQILHCSYVGPGSASFPLWCMLKIDNLGTSCPKLSNPVVDPQVTEPVPHKTLVESGLDLGKFPVQCCQEPDAHPLGKVWCESSTPLHCQMTSSSLVWQMVSVHSEGRRQVASVPQRSDSAHIVRSYSRPAGLQHVNYRQKGKSPRN